MMIRATLAALAIAQLAVPAPQGLLVPVCGHGAPIRLPIRDHGPCHVALRKPGCCGPEDNPDA